MWYEVLLKEKDMARSAYAALLSQYRAKESSPNLDHLRLNLNRKKIVVCGDSLRSLLERIIQKSDGSPKNKRYKVRPIQE